MDLRKIQAFIIVAEELNFRKAAEILGMTQPPLTRLIALLEDDLGVKLLTRSTRSVELTGAGVHFLRRSRIIINELETLKMEVRSLKKIKKEKISISFSIGVIHSSLPRVISSYRQQFPKVEIEFIELPQHLLEKKLRSGAVDITFGVNPFKEDNTLSSLEIYKQEIGVLMSTDNPLAKKRSIGLEDLEGQTIIFHQKQERIGFQEDFYDFLKRKGIKCKIYYKKTSENCSTLATFGKGLLLTSPNIAKLIPGTTFIPFEGFQPKLSLLAHWTKDNTSSALSTFVSFLNENSFIPKSEADTHFS